MCSGKIIVHLCVRRKSTDTYYSPAHKRAAYNSISSSANQPTPSKENSYKEVQYIDNAAIFNR